MSKYIRFLWVICALAGLARFVHLLPELREALKDSQDFTTLNNNLINIAFQELINLIMFGSGTYKNLLPRTTTKLKCRRVKLPNGALIDKIKFKGDSESLRSIISDLLNPKLESENKKSDNKEKAPPEKEEQDNLNK